MGDKSFETDFNNDGFFQRKQIQIDMCWPRPHHYWGGHAETEKLKILIVDTFSPVWVNINFLYINQFD